MGAFIVIVLKIGSTMVAWQGVDPRLAMASYDHHRIRRQTLPTQQYIASDTLNLFLSQKGDTCEIGG